MTSILTPFKETLATAIEAYADVKIDTANLPINNTRPEFEGDFTLVTFGLTKALKKSPQVIAEELGTYLVENGHCQKYNVVKGFLNLTLNDADWHSFLMALGDSPNYGQGSEKESSVMIEYSSPNTNKPLHLGHIRNFLLGTSCANLLETAGYPVVRTQIINDRGIAICKSMLAWKKNGQGETPESSGIKGDHFVGKYYVMFEQMFKQEYSSWQESQEAIEAYEAEKKPEEQKEAFFARYKNTYFNTHSQLGSEARKLLLDWEAGDSDTIQLWKQMNQWVFDGFNQTYEKLGITFDKSYYESQTYLLGKDIIEDGLSKGVFYKKEDNSVWIDLTDAGMDHKLVLRSDGTSVYMTQDLGTAELRYEDFNTSKMVYTVADEQNYHFKVLFEICKRLGRPYAAGMHHLSYGMVELPSGKMKSREGTVVDADDLLDEVIAEARSIALDKGEIANLSSEEQDNIVSLIGKAALKYHMIKVQPKKKMLFDPAESVDMQGQTGPYIQNAYVRIKSVLRKVEKSEDGQMAQYDIQGIERQVLIILSDYPDLIQEAAAQYDPSAIANYCYKLAKAYHKFYSELSIKNAESSDAKNFRLALSSAVATTLENAMRILGIEMPEKM